MQKTNGIYVSISPHNVTPSQYSLLIYLFLFKELHYFALLPFILPDAKQNKNP